MYGVFSTQGQVTLKWPEFELVTDFMADLVTCKFKDDSFKVKVSA